MLEEPLLATTSKGGLKTLPFIIANESFEKVASYGLLPNMITYLMGSYGMELATGSNFIYYWSAATSLAPVLAAFLADSYVGRFWMIAFGSIISFLGITLLWFTTIIPSTRPCDESGTICTSPTIFQLTILVSSFMIMSIGAGGIRSSSLAFGTDQLIKKKNVNHSGLLERFFNWYYFATSVSVMIATTLVVYVQENFGWKLGFGVPVICMFLSAISFLLASPLYIKLKAEAGSPIGFTRVFIAAWKKRHFNVYEWQDDQFLYFRRKGSRLMKPTHKLRFLNKACMIQNIEEELTLDGEIRDPWSLCTIEQVEELKSLIKVVPIWSTGIIMSTVTAQTPFKVLLIKTMNRHITSNFEIPAGSFSTFTIISIILWIAIYDLIIIPSASKIMRKPVKLNPRTRMGIGVILSFLSMVITSLVEGVRRETAIKEGFSDDASGVTDMSALWLLPHHWFSGMAEAFYTIAQSEFFCSEFPSSMLSVATNLHGVGMSLASLIASFIFNTIDKLSSNGGKESWVSSNINRAHFDYYYWVLTGLCLVNCFYYFVCDKAYGPSSDEEQDKLLLDEGSVEYR
ncbi:unnamed protein product [Amaranthus hypochondriacus]